MAQIRIYIDKDYGQTPTYTYDVPNATEDTTQPFYQFLDQTDTYGNNAWDDIVGLVSGSSAEYEYTTNNRFGTYFRFWTQMSGEKTFNNVSTSVTAQKDQWWDAEIFLRTKPITVILSFDTNGGSPASYQSVSKTDYPSASGYISVQIPSNYSPTKTNYDFDGWLIGGNIFHPGEWVGLDSDTTATAKWVRQKVQIQLTTTSTSDSITATVANPDSMPSDFDHYFWQIDSTDAGTDTTGTHEFTGLTKGNTYTIKCGGYNSSNEQIAYGTKQATTTSSNAWIYTSSGWKLATPYVYTSSGWKEAQAYIYTSSGWIPC